MTFVWALAIVFLAAASAGLAGFGFSIISVPMLLIFYDPSTVIALNKILTIGTTWVVLLDTWRYVSWVHLKRLVPFSIIGLVGGIVVLKMLDPQMIKLIVGVTVILFALLLLSGLIRHVEERRWMAPVTGLVSGLSSTSTGMSGPPLVLFFTVIGLSVQAFRGTSVCYFLIIDLVGFPALVSQGLISRTDLVLSLFLAPAAIAGRWAGSWFVPYVTPTSFRRVVLCLLLATGGFAIANAVATM
jgi:uncharacterized membrane protein YfcA